MILPYDTIFVVKLEQCKAVLQISDENYPINVILNIGTIYFFNPKILSYII